MIKVQIENDAMRSAIEKAATLFDEATDFLVTVTAMNEESIKLTYSADKSESKQEAALSLPLKQSDFCKAIAQIIKKNTVPNFKEVFDLGDYLFEPAEFHLKKHKTDEIISLTEKERNILWCLCTQKQHVLSREALLKKIWNYVPDIETHTLETHIYRLRQKIEQDPSEPKIIVTVENGYRIATLIN